MLSDKIPAVLVSVFVSAVSEEEGVIMQKYQMLTQAKPKFRLLGT